MTGPPAWLIDTNFISEVMRPRPEPRGAALLNAIEAEGIGLASITVWEVLDGIGRLASSRRRRGLADRFHDPLEDLFEDRILEWTLSYSRACARITEDKGRRGEALDDQVLGSFLAAEALARGSAVVTRNTGEFRNTGLKTVETWTARAR